MQRTVRAGVMLFGLGWLAGCDGNPDGPSFPTVPPGTKVVPANTTPVAIPDDLPAKKEGLRVAPAQPG